MARETPNDGIVALREFTRRRLLVTKPHVLADVLVHRYQDFEKPENMRRFLRNLVGDGLLMLEGEPHKFMRRSTNPAFNFRRIKDLYPMMWKNSLAFREVLEADLRAQSPAADTPQGSAEVIHWANKITLNIIGNSLLGKDLNVFGGREDKLVKSYEVVFDPSKEMLLYFVLSAWFSHRLANALPWRMGRVFKETTGTLKSICVQMARDRREEIKKGAQHVDILTQLIKLDVFSDDELGDQLLTFLAAG
jgi:cytochrome P450